MKFNVKAKSLLAQLVAVGKAISPKTTVKILSNFLFELADGTLTITGSDTENTITTTLALEYSEGNGKFCIESRRLIEILKALPNCDVTFTIDDENFAVGIKYDKGQFDMAAMSGNDYPKNDAIDPTSIIGTLTMAASQILEALDKVSFATSNDELRPIMNGVLWDVAENAITFVATDTHVLSKYRNTHTKPGAAFSFVLSGRAIPIVRALIGREANISITVTGNAIHIKGDSFSMKTCKVSGNYPNYNRVIPANPPYIIEVDRMELADAVDRVSICADAQQSLIRMKVSPMDIVVSAQDLGFNVGGSESVICSFSGSDMEIGFSATYLKGVLKTLNTQKIFLKLTGHNTPALFLPSENDEFGELTLLCMPMTINA